MTAVSFPQDPLALDLEQFVQAVGASTYWKATTSEYGVGPATATMPVHVASAAPPMINDAGIQSWLASNLDGTHPEWPAVDSNSLYVLYFPAVTMVTQAGTTPLCSGGAAAYHASFALPTGQPVAYAVVPRCSSGTHDTLDLATLLTSHEIIEAVTDPLPRNLPAYQSVGNDHYAWTFTGNGSEVGDLCEHDASSDYFAPDLGFLVQRTWSNLAALDGHDPCVPRALGDVYFEAAPVATDPITLSFATSKTKLATNGIQLAMGGSKTIDVALFSDAPLAAPISVWAEQFPIDRTVETSDDLAFSFDRSSGGNGDTLHLTIQVKSDHVGEGHQYFVVYSQLGDQQHRWPVIVAQ